DRLGASIDMTSGDHVLGLKVCSGALADEGRVRVHATDASGKPLELSTSAAFAKRADVAQRPVFHAVATSLERALRVGDKAALLPSFSASILRTLGGADDLRSLRAPGMIDKIGKTRGLSPDLLAMAGWISPFGAVRSGFLNLAIERALGAHDLATANFA